MSLPSGVNCLLALSSVFQVGKTGLGGGLAKTQFSREGFEQSAPGEGQEFINNSLDLGL